MAASTFGVTAALLQSDMFPHYTFSATSHPTSTAVGTIITRAGAVVSGLVDARGLNANALDATGEPIAYYFCQRLTLVGAALDVARAFTGSGAPGELVDTLRREWMDGLKALRDPQLGKAMLVDAYGSATAGRIRTHVQDTSSLPTTSTDLSIDDPEFTGGMDL